MLVWAETTLVWLKRSTREEDEAGMTRIAENACHFGSVKTAHQLRTWGALVALRQPRRWAESAELPGWKM